jgi:TolB-like protein
MQPTTWASTLVVSAVALLAGCAGGQPPPAASPANIPALEAQRAANPRDADLATRVGIAYYEAKDYTRARDVLLAALALNKSDYPARIYLGLSQEELGQLDSARVSYTAAAAIAGNNVQREDVQNHLALLTRKELRASAQAALAQEASLSSQAPSVNAVAVLPFTYVGANADLAPVGRGLTQLMITDLAKLNRLTLLEREQVQALVDEMALTDQGRVSAASGARSGRLLRAGRVVQGSLQDVPGGVNLRLDANVVNATDASIVASGSAAERLQALFDLQKQVLLQLVSRMGITLTPAERRALSERPTADLQAFLAFSRGLEEEDRGDFAAAAADFSTAVARDPNFRAARDRQQNAQHLSQAQGMSARTLAGLGPLGSPGGAPQAPPTGRGTILRTTLGAAVPTTTTGLTNRIGTGSLGPVSQAPGVRPPLPEALGTDNPGNPGGLVGSIIIIITRP